MSLSRGLLWTGTGTRTLADRLIGPRPGKHLLARATGKANIELFGCN